MKSEKMMRQVAMTILLCASVCFAHADDTWGINGFARAYFESAYCSSTGNLGYTKPVAEQYFELRGTSPGFGYLTTSGWIFSSLNDQQQAQHRRAFSCYEGTLMYGYPIEFAPGVRLSTAGGFLWDWLGGYEAEHGIPICWHAVQTFANPYLTPYWNALGGGVAACDHWTRIRFGIKRAFKPYETLSLAPFWEVTWVDSDRFYLNYGDTPGARCLGGAFAFSMPGLIAQWNFYRSWSIWFRYRQYILIDEHARSLVRARGRETDRRELAIFALGLVYSF